MFKELSVRGRAAAHTFIENGVYQYLPGLLSWIEVLSSIDAAEVISVAP